MEQAQTDGAATVAHFLQPGEKIQGTVTATESVVVLTDQRLMVVSATRIALDVPFREVRRIQLDVEKNRPSTLVIVPEQPSHEAQVLTVPDTDLDRTCAVVTQIGVRMRDQ